MPEQGPWQFGVSSSTIYGPVLDYCPDRELRKTLWQQLVAIGSVLHTTDGYSTKNDIENIRIARSVFNYMY